MTANTQRKAVSSGLWVRQGNQELCRNAPMVFLGGALALTSCSTMNFCNCHLLGTEPWHDTVASRTGLQYWGTTRKGCSALKPAEVSNPAPASFSNSLPIWQMQTTPSPYNPSNKMQVLAQEEGPRGPLGLAFI